MKLDPNEACANEKERMVWAVLHDAVCHPLMAVTGYSKWSVRFHDWTSFRAWPRPIEFVVSHRSFPTLGYGLLKVSEIAPGIWNIAHPRVRHQLRVQAKNRVDAVAKAIDWFNTLSEEFGGKFLCQTKLPTLQEIFNKL